VSVYRSQRGDKFLWEGGKSGSGRRRNGKYAAELKKYLKGAVKRHGALGESFATEEAARHLRLIANSRSLHPKLKNAMLGAADDLESNLAHGRESLALVLKIAKGRGSAERGIVKDIKKIASLVRMPVTEGVIGESMRVAKHFYVVDKRTGKVVSRGFPQVDDADEFFEKDKNFKHKTHQVISGWALSDRAFKLSEARSKTMVIMRGLPGSGKSTAAKKAAGSAPIYSTDDFFMKGGEYKFDRSKIVKAHEWNQKRTKKALAKGLPKIVIDNTNVQLWEMRAYVEMAQEHGYDVEFVVAKTPWAWNVPKLTKRNTHGVPEEIISRMKSDFQRSATVKKVLASKAPWE
jgi:predicted kinase